VDEFDLIRRYFTSDARAPGVVVGVGDDGAIVDPSSGLHQVQVIDTLVEDVHFPSGLNAADVGYRAVAVNLSDIASMGATPRWMTLALTLSDKDEVWVGEFAKGLFAAASEYDVALIGGDTTQGEVVVATIPRRLAIRFSSRARSATRPPGSPCSMKVDMTSFSWAVSCDRRLA
jgi:thiamine-monophosphate kinase